MMSKLGKNLIPLLAICCASPVLAHAEPQACSIEDRFCVLSEMKAEAAKIENQSWRDQTYREIAKTYAFDGDVDSAIAMIDMIENPDTQAMTIRGIAMAIAPQGYDQEKLDEIFSKLRTSAEKIEHPPSYAIALTYIAMGQAFAEDDFGAWKTASEMENDALRHKAYGETAEIQAERGDYEAAMKSISYIDSDAYRNKSYALVAQILADRDQYEEAFKSALAITNAYKKTNAMQYILDQQKPREVER